MPSDLFTGTREEYDAIVRGHCAHPLPAHAAFYWWSQRPRHHARRGMDSHRWTPGSKDLPAELEDAENERATARALGICPQCGACSAKAAEGRCTASQGMTGEYSCEADGLGLWEDEE